MIGRELQWALGFSVVASVAALLWRPGGAVSPAVDPARASSIGAQLSALPPASPSQAMSPQSKASSVVLAPQPITNVQMSSVSAGSPAPTFDPFTGVVAAPVVPTVQTAAPAPTPVAPPPAYHFAGRLRNPSGVEQVFLSRGDALVAVTAGTQLDDGYVVESMNPDSVLLRYPALGAQARISIAPAQYSRSP